jgi:hypothetical protein
MESERSTVGIGVELIEFQPASSPQLDVPGGGVPSNNVEVFPRPQRPPTIDLPDFVG